jgi:hypothetical protein
MKDENLRICHNIVLVFFPPTVILFAFLGLLTTTTVCFLTGMFVVSMMPRIYTTLENRYPESFGICPRCRTRLTRDILSPKFGDYCSNEDCEWPQ